jgi:vacuolar-type H+-ATPase subunit F/Vma7
VAHIVYIGDEATAAGFRLAGLDTRTAAPGDAGEQLHHALAETPDCVLLDGSLVDFVPRAMLDGALDADSPLFAVVPDIRGRGAPPDLAQIVRSALGIDA